MAYGLRSILLFIFTNSARNISAFFVSGYGVGFGWSDQRGGSLGAHLLGTYFLFPFSKWGKYHVAFEMYLCMYDWDGLFGEANLDFKILLVFIIVVHAVLYYMWSITPHGKQGQCQCNGIHTRYSVYSNNTDYGNRFMMALTPSSLDDPSPASCL